jgi:methyl-accepting chemotaxis protein
MRALDVMNKSLANIVREVRNGTENITVASREIAMSNSDLSSRTEQQASSLEETASAIEELTSTVKANAESARQAAKFVEGATNVAAKGGRMVDEVVHTMSDISESSKKISAIIGVIDGIAFQTNILALNAAVEAARAGDEGRGFAVVAAEVRTLALRSAAAAKEIKTLIGESGDRVEVGARLVGEAGKTMQEIVESVTSANDIISQIALSSREQSAGIEQVNQAIMHMEEATHQNAALVEEAAATAEHLAAQAEELEKAIASFKVNEASDIVADGSGVDGHSSTMRSAPSPARKARTQAALVLRRNRTPPVRALRKNDNNEDWTEL